MENGETPRLTTKGKTITCIMDNFVPLVVPGLSSSSSSSSASTSRPKDQSNSSGDSETSSHPVTTRSDKRPCRKPMQTDLDKQASENRGPRHKKDEMNKEDPTQGIPDWLQPFTDNLEDLETPEPAHFSEREISDSEGDASKVETQKRKHSIYTHFTKDRNCDRCLRTKITRFPCRRRDKGSIPRAEKFGDLKTADHKVLNEGSESRNNHRYAVVVQDLATHWIQSYQCKNTNSQETEKSLRKFLEPSQKAKVICTDNSLTSDFRHVNFWRRCRWRYFGNIPLSRCCRHPFICRWSRYSRIHFHLKIPLRPSSFDRFASAPLISKRFSAN